MRKRFYWKLRDRELQLGARTLLMGVLNVTPDSFSDGGQFTDPDRAYARALELEEQGADIIDIGGESTKPGSHRITADEEWQRLVPILKRLRGKLQIPISIDTYKAEIAERALEYGIEIINDPTGLTFDPDLARAAANGNAGLVLNHMRGQPETWAKLPPLQNAPATIARELEATANRARHAGVERARIVIDPGLGFGKRREQNAEIIAHLGQLAMLEYPILIGPSRKSFLAKASEQETIFATASAVAAAVLNGAHIVRVHDVKEMRAVVQVAEEIANAASQEEERGAQRRPHAGPSFEAERPRPPRPPVRQATPPPDKLRPAAAAPPPERSQIPGTQPPPNQTRRGDERRDQRGGPPPPKRRFEPRREDREWKPPRRDREFPKRDGRLEKPDRPKKPFRKEFGSDRPKDSGFRSGFRKDRGDRGDRPPQGGPKPPGKRPFRKRP